MVENRVPTTVLYHKIMKTTIGRPGSYSFQIKKKVSQKELYAATDCAAPLTLVATLTLVV